MPLSPVQEVIVSTVGAGAWLDQARAHVARGEYALARRALRIAVSAARAADAELKRQGIDVATDAEFDAAEMRGAFDR